MIHFMIRIGKFILLIFLLSACSINVDNLEGTYVATNFIKTVDTLKLIEENNYYRSIHDKTNGKLIFQNKGVWYLEDGRLILKDFLRNMDEHEYYNENVNFKHSLIKYELEISNSIFGSRRFYVNYDLNQYYKKMN